MDTREQILSRLAAIAVDLSGFKSAVRNRGLRDNEKRPAVIILDGDEAPVLTHGGRQNRAHAGRTMSMTPQVMAMKPELYVLMDEARPQNEDLGPALNAKRVQFVKAIAEDDQLLALLGSNGGILYNGCVTDLKSGMPLSGQMRLDFMFSYTFFPTTNQQGAS
jgi:hypothetical protein